MIADAIDGWAKVHPDKPAIDYDGEVWSYRELARAIVLARGELHAMGVAGEGVAAVAIQDTRDLWVVSLALRSLGVTTIVPQSAAALAGLDLPQLRWVIASAAEPWGALETVCAARGLPRLVIPMARTRALGLDQARPTVTGGHILQTSGTTGAYKLVLFDASFEAGYMAQRRVATSVSASTVLNVFDFAVWTGVGYKSPVCVWLAGGTVVITQRRDPALALNRPGLTLSYVVPTLLRTLLDADEGAYPRLPDMQLSIAGGTITQAEIDRARERITPHILNGLGATESLCMAVTPMRTPDDHRWQIPSPGARIEIVDDDDRVVPVGRIGRLRIESRDSPQGYLNDPVATREFFKGGFFYPGDLAVRRDDGRFALMGRVTDVINVAGHKISPQPIEDRLREALAVGGVCLCTMQDPNGEETLHAVIEAAVPLDPERLATLFRAALPDVAGVRVHYAQALPRNEMGKVMRKAVAERLAAAQR